MFSWSFKQYLRVSLPILLAIPYSVTLKLQKDHKGSINRDINGLKKVLYRKTSTCNSKSFEACPFKLQKSKHSKADPSTHIQNAN